MGGVVGGRDRDMTRNAETARMTTVAPRLSLE
jgi:hypothetical protein